MDNVGMTQELNMKAFEIFLKSETNNDIKQNWKDFQFQGCAKGINFEDLFVIVQNSLNFCKILHDSARFCETLRISARFWENLWNSARFCEFLQDSERPWETLPDSARLYQTLPDSARLCQTLQDSARIWETLKANMIILNDYYWNPNDNTRLFCHRVRWYIIIKTNATYY